MSGPDDPDDDAVLAELTRLAEAGELPPDEAAEVAALVAARRDRAESAAAPPATAQAPGRRFGWLLYLLPALLVAGLVIGVGAVVRRDDGPDKTPLERILDDPDIVVGVFGGDLPELSIVYSPDVGDGLLSGDDVEAPPTGEVYQLWRTEADEGDGDLVSLGVFTPDASGTVEVLLDGAESPADVAYTVTLEPTGGSEQPTGDVIAETG
jgi:anti-sigma-K factor RskA